MCGIAGVVGGDPHIAVRAVERMCRSLARRGPDDERVTSFGDAVLGCRRLAIIDPSQQGSQPMTDAVRGTGLVFNGMIYNYRELRIELGRLGERFRSQSDTEVVLRAYGCWGERCVERFRGMFAIAVWDERDHSLFLARDRLGIKPLYTSATNGVLLFASQVKALVASGLVAPVIDPQAVLSFLQWGAVAEPHCIVAGVRPLAPGTCARYRDGSLSVRRYWYPPEAGRYGNAPQVEGDLGEILGEAVSAHLVADRPVGVFLSGGLDSAFVAALAARTGHALTTVTASTPGDPEGPAVARRLARTMGARHIDASFVDAAEEWLDDAFDAMDQPSFDGLNTYLVARSAVAAGLRVALSGLGADELFDGYGYARQARAMLRTLRAPRTARLLALRPVTRVASMNVEKAAFWLRQGSPSDLYRVLRQVFLEEEIALLVPSLQATLRPTEGAWFGGDGDLVGELTRLELDNYLKNVTLRDTDAMSMGVGLEVRVPYLDDRVVNHVLGLPAGGLGYQKQLLSRVAEGLLPAEVLTRRKIGFAMPLARWLEGQTEWGHSASGVPDALEGLLDRRAVETVWARASRDPSYLHRAWALRSLCRWIAAFDRHAARGTATLSGPRQAMWRP